MRTAHHMLSTSTLPLHSDTSPLKRPSNNHLRTLPVTIRRHHRSIALVFERHEQTVRHRRHVEGVLEQQHPPDNVQKLASKHSSLCKELRAMSLDPFERGAIEERRPDLALGDG
jgi:hypothetical protein